MAKRKELIRFSLELVIIVAVTATVCTKIVVPVKIQGDSMYPTLHDKDTLIVNKLYLNRSDIKRFDIVVLKSDKLNQDIIKRVIGLPGDNIVFKDDKLYINGKFIEEPYLDDLKNSERWKRNGNFAKLTQDFTLESLPATNTKKVPENMLFVMGDNRIDSKDSRYFGFISVDKVIGKMIYPKLNEKTGN